jgi:hypothetical protein
VRLAVDCEELVESDARPVRHTGPCADAGRLNSYNEEVWDTRLEGHVPPASARSWVERKRAVVRVGEVRIPVLDVPGQPRIDPSATPTMTEWP